MVKHHKPPVTPPSEAAKVLSRYAGQNLKSAPDKPSRRRSFKRFLKRLAIATVIIVLVLGSWLGFTFYNNVAKITGNRNPLQVLSLFIPAHLDETNGRVNILVAGNSTDDPGHGGADLTDSIMIISVNPKTKTAVLLSIPRDTWVNVPGFGYSKINAAYQDGQQENFNQTGYAHGGMGLLEEVVQQNFGVSPNYYALVNYSAVRNSVNAVGGITLTINSPEPQGLYDPYTN
ncbi:MAG: LCP family protein, partial [Candidatus Saccharimonadales bacterium]